MNTAWHRSELTYCTNVHSGENLQQVRKNICGALAKVRSNRGLHRMSGGLWLSKSTATELLSAKNLQLFSSMLDRKGISLFTLNGFPAHNFHAERVKETVYQPDWSEPQRLEYTLQLASILATYLQQDNNEGTISTVPLGFSANWNRQKHQQALLALCQCVVELDKIYQQSGKKIRVCLEMEPACVLQSTDALISFFTTDMAEFATRQGLSARLIDDHLGICFDVCHQAVMFEDSYQALQQIQQAGIRIGKIQISSALQLKNPQDPVARTVLAEFIEAKYLHQTCCLDEQGQLHEVLDLDLAFTNLPDTGPWRVHFHVPIQAKTLISEALGSTQNEICRTLDFLQHHPHIHPHLEVETYTWAVLPESIRPTSEHMIINGLTTELQWLEAQMKQRNLLQDDSQP